MGGKDDFRMLVSLKTHVAIPGWTGAYILFLKCVLSHMSGHELTRNTQSTVSIIIIIISHFPHSLLSLGMMMIAWLRAPPPPSHPPQKKKKTAASLYNGLP